MSLARSPSTKCRASREAQREAHNVGETHEHEARVVRERSDPRASHGSEAKSIEVGELTREKAPAYRAVGECERKEHGLSLIHI